MNLPLLNVYGKRFSLLCKKGNYTACLCFDFPKLEVELEEAHQEILALQNQLSIQSQQKIAHETRRYNETHGAHWLKSKAEGKYTLCNNYGLTNLVYFFFPFRYTTCTGCPQKFGNIIISTWNCICQLN